MFSYCYPRYLFKVQTFIKIPTKYTKTEINIGRIECASLQFQKVGVVWVWSQSNPPFKKSAYAPDFTSFSIHLLSLTCASAEINTTDY